MGHSRGTLQEPAVSQQNHQTHLEELPVPICKPALKSHPLNRRHSGKTPEKSDMDTSPSQKTTWVVISKCESASLTQKQQSQVMLSQGMTEQGPRGLPAAGISVETRSTCTKASKQPAPGEPVPGCPELAHMLVAVRS